MRKGSSNCSRKRSFGRRGYLFLLSSMRSNASSWPYFGLWKEEKKSFISQANLLASSPLLSPLLSPKRMQFLKWVCQNRLKINMGYVLEAQHRRPRWMGGSRPTTCIFLDLLMTLRQLRKWRSFPSSSNSGWLGPSRFWTSPRKLSFQHECLLIKQGAPRRLSL